MATTKAFELAQLSALTNVDASGNVTTNTSQIANASGDLTLDSVAGDIILDAHGNQVIFKGSGGQVGFIDLATGRMDIKSSTADQQMRFQGNDAGVPINALVLDMSASGAAIFNDQVTIGGNLIHAGNLTIDAGGDITLNADGADVILADGTVTFGRFARIVDDFIIKAETVDKDIILRGTKAGTPDVSIDALVLDMSNDGRATFNENVIIQGDLTVEGTQVTLNTTALDVEDKNITLNYHATNDTSASADGAGITIQDAVSQGNDATILWDATNDKFEISHETQVYGNLSVGVGNSKEAFIQATNSGRVASNPAYSFRSDVDTGMFNPNIDNTIAFATGGTERLRINGSGDTLFYENNGGTPQVGMHWDYTDGRLGIGTTAPDSLLDVKIAEDTLANVLANEIYAATFLSTTSGNAGHTTAIMLSGSSGTNRGVAIAAEAQSTGNDHDMIFATSASGATPTEHVRITSLGGVGIGTDSPDDFAVGPFVVGDGATVQGMTIYTGNSHEGIIRFADGTSGSQQYEGQVKYDHNDNKMRFYTNHAERLRLDNAGSVITKSTSLDYYVDKKIENATGSGNADRYILLAKTNVGGGVKFIGSINGTRQLAVSAHGYIDLQVGFSLTSTGTYPKFYVDYISGWNDTQYKDTTARWVTLDYDDGNGSATWWAIELSSNDNTSWTTDLTNMHFKGYMSNVTPTVISSDTSVYNAVSNITELGRGATRGIMHTDVGIGTTNPQGGLHLWSSDYDRFVIERDNGGSNVVAATLNSYGSTTNTNPRLAIGVGSTADTATNTMNIAPGAVGIGTFDPQVSLHIGDGSTDEFIILDKGTSNTSGILLKNGGNNKVKLLANSSEELELHTNNTRKVRVNELGTVYNYTSEPTIKPVLSLDFMNTNELDHRVSFSRKNAATYVDSDGYVKVAPHGVPRFTHNPTTLEPEGLLIEPFAKNQLHKWQIARGQYSVSNGYIIDRAQVLSPAGDMTAMKMVSRVTGTQQVYMKPNIALDSANSWHTFSVYMKKAEHRYMLMRSDNQSNWCLFDLDTGVIDTSGNGDAEDIYAVMTPHNNGWWRIEYTHYVTGQTGNDVEIFFSDVNRNGTTAIGYGDGVYFWGMQMEGQAYEKMRATSLIPNSVYSTTTQTNHSTFMDSRGRVSTAGIGNKDGRQAYGLWNENYLPAGEMIENTSTNRIRSHNPGLQETGWVYSNVDVDWTPSNIEIAPDGITKCPKIIDTTSNTRHSIAHTTTSAQTDGVWNSWSFWIKSEGTNRIHLELGNQGSTYSAIQFTFDTAVTDPNTGIVTGLIGGTYKDSLVVKHPNGWYHVRFNTIASSNGSTYYYFALKDDAAAITYTGDGSKGIWLWGVQLEFGRYWPSSLITTTEAEITRASDTFDDPTAIRYEDMARVEKRHFKDIYDNTQGTLLADATFGVSGRVGMYWDGDNDQIEIYSSGDTIHGFLYRDGATQVNLNTSYDSYTDASHKYALAWRRDDSSIFYKDATLIGSDANNIPPQHLEYLNLGYYINTKVIGTSKIKKVEYYDRRLDGVNLQALTEND